MAARYWVGGTASWDATAGTKWALTDGGAGGAAVPTSSDDVFFTALSGAVAVTSTVTVYCLSLTCTGFTGTISGSGSMLIYGNVLIAAGMVWSHTGNMQFPATSGSFTITSAGKTLGPVFIQTTTATYTLQDALTSSSALTVTSGTFTTNNYAVTATALSSSNTNTRTINLGSSTVTLTNNGIAWATGNPLNLALNAGTSTVVMTGASAAFDIATLTLTFNNLSFTSTASGTHNLPQSVNGTIFNNLTFAGMAVAGVRIVQIPGRQTINGTLSTTGTAGNRRVWFRSNTYGIAQTLTINSAPSLTDADFRDIYVVGTAAPISGTRVGDLRGIRGITADAPKTVYWNLVTGGSWSANAWATTSGGAVSTDNFPLAQDTAIIGNTGLNTSQLVQLTTGVSYIGSIDLSGRTLAMTLDVLATQTLYGNLTLGSGTGISGTATLIFSGRNTQTLTSAGKNFTSPITIDSYGGTVELADALTLSGAAGIAVTNGTFDTKNFNVTAFTFTSNNSNVRTINLGASTLTFSGTNAISMASITNLTFNSGTSTFIQNSAGTGFFGAGLAWYNVNLSATGAGTKSVTGANTFNNLIIAAPASAGLIDCNFSANQTINGTLTVAGATAVRRIFLRSSVLGTTRTLTVNSLSAQDCDFRDITIAGAASGATPTRAGDCGGNTGITFPSPKTVYWNLAGAQNWSATGWCPSSGGTPDINQFPLAQDAAVFDNTGSVTGTITVNAAWNVGTFDASARTSAMALTAATGFPIYGNWLFGTGCSTVNNSGSFIFNGRGTQTITSNGVSFIMNVIIDCFTGTVQLADALTLTAARTLTLTSGTFDAVTYNLTTGSFIASGSALASVLKMGSGTWTLTAVAVTPWNMSASNFTFYKGTANLSMSIGNQFTGGNLSYNKLTLTGSTAGQTSYITGNNQFTELASTVTIAHTLNLGTTAQTFGKWSVTGTAGNVVTVTGTGVAHVIAGARVSGVDYLAMNGIGFAATSPGEFYAGANSTGTNATIIKTAAPAAVTRYWVGGTGTWDTTTTTKWSASSGGAGGASVPTSADAVVFDSASNATAYTVTCTATQLRCGSLTMAGPASGNVTWAGSAPIAMHDNVTLAATGITRTYTGAITLTGSATGKTLTTNGVQLASGAAVNGVGCGWSLGGAVDTQSTFTVTNGSFNTANYTFSIATLSSTLNNTRVINLGSSTINTNASAGINIPSVIGLEFNTGTSQINLAATGSLITAGTGLTFYNVSFTSTALTTPVINGVNTFNNLTVAGRVAAGISPIQLTANQTINGTLTLSAGTDATMRTFLRSDTIGTTRTLTCAAVATPTDIDFRDIAITGAAAPVSGTRLGDCKGNSGITFDAAKTVYYRNTAGNWGATTWAFTNGGTADITAFPLAQDTAVFPSAPTPYPSSGATCTSTVAYNIGTIDMSARTTNTMTLATSTSAPTIYGNWINGTGTTLTGTGVVTFAGRGSQAITSAGKTFTQGLSFDNISGSITCLDALVNTDASVGLRLTSGTFNANGYNITTGFWQSTNVNARTISVGSGSWVISGAGSGAWQCSTSTNLAVTGTGTVSFTSASSKSFQGGSISYSGITLNQGGAGALTITGNNTFANITNTSGVATSILLGTTTQKVGTWDASGTVGNVLTVSGTSASSPATLIVTGTPSASLDYMTITGVRAYPLETTWYAGANSMNNGSLGWYFVAGTIVVPTSSIYYGSINITAIYYGSTLATALYYGSTKVF